MDRIMRKVYNFLEFFIPHFYMIGGFILVTKGIEIMEELSGISYYIVAVAIIFMVFGICGKQLQEIGIDEVIENDKKKRIKKNKRSRRAKLDRAPSASLKGGKINGK